MQPTILEAMPQLGKNYLSVRLTLPHSNADDVVSKICHDVPAYCIYKHSTNGEHMHVCLPGLGTTDSEKIRKRIKDKFKLKGNGGFSVECNTNGCRSFVFYCGHEGTAPLYADPRWKEIVESVTEYYVKPTKKPAVTGMKRQRDGDWPLTYTNIVPKALEYAQENSLDDLSFYDVVQHMCYHTRYKPTKQMFTDGLCAGGCYLQKRYDAERRGDGWRTFPRSWMGPAVRDL